jgi:hypothetical protein
MLPSIQGIPQEARAGRIGRINDRRTMKEPLPEQFQQYITSELKYIRQRVDDLYNRHYLLYAKVAGISAVVSTIVVILGIAL